MYVRMHGMFSVLYRESVCMYDTEYQSYILLMAYASTY